jgi:uncharacterized membrane protein YoaK (UPF0700 family)
MPPEAPPYQKTTPLMADSLPTHSSPPPKRSPSPPASSSSSIQHAGPNGTTNRPPPTPTPTPTLTRARAYLAQRVSTRHASILLLVCCLISGLIDSVAYNAWSTFISMQTGNTIFLGLGASNQPTSKPYGWAKSLTSIGCFFIGCVAFSRGMRRRWRRHHHHRALFGGAKGTTRGALMASFALQAALMLAAAGLVQARVVPVPTGSSSSSSSSSDLLTSQGGDPDFMELLPVGLLAFQGGGQFVASRLLGFSEIPTVVLTSVYCDLGMDERLLGRDNDKRDHRVGAVVMIALGAIAGGWISRSQAGMATAMWVAAALKLAIAVAWVFWRGEDSG